MTGPPVTVFPTCLAELLRPGLGELVARLARDSGAEARLARGATCCGQPAWNAGFVPEARRVARRTLRALARTSGEVVVPSGSCATMLRHHWPELFAGTRQAAAAGTVAGRVRELSEVLAGPASADRSGRLGGGAGGATGGERAPPQDSQVAYHDSCHMLRELRLRAEPRAVLAGCGMGVREVAGAERCCGFGGTFAVKLPGVSVAMADEKLDEWVASGAGTVVGSDLSCLAHLEARARRRGLPLRFRHLAEVAADG